MRRKLSEVEVLKTRLRDVDPQFAEVVMKIPKRDEPYLSPYWLHMQMLERYLVLQRARIERGMNVLEIGCGAHAIATVPLAHMVGENGRVVAVDIERLGFFEEIVGCTGLRKRVIPVMCDATALPFKFRWFDLSVVVHAIRSFRDESTIASIMREMLRVSSRVFIAETLPLAKTPGQDAHLEMYNLREEIFEALYGRKDDLHYFDLEKLRSFIEMAGGVIVDAGIVETGLPHHLAFIPKEYVEKIGDERRREELLERWHRAYRKLREYGEEHPPVGVIMAVPGDKC